MAGRTFAKVTATTSMTNHQRRQARQKAKDAKKGVVDPPAEPSPTAPRRAGLRGVQMAFFHDQPPRRVVPRPTQATQPKTIPVPCLEGQEDIPSSDSECANNRSTMVPLGQHKLGPEVPSVHNDDDAQSQASTVIEYETGDHSSADSQDDECANVRDLHKNRNALTAETPGSMRRGSAACSTPSLPTGNTHITEGTTNCLTGTNPENTDTEVIPAAPVYLLNQPTGITIFPAATPQGLPLDPTIGEQTHPFGPPTDVSSTLVGLSESDLELLNAPFPPNASSTFESAPNFFSFNSDPLAASSNPTFGPGAVAHSGLFPLHDNHEQDGLSLESGVDWSSFGQPAVVPCQIQAPNPTSEPTGLFSSAHITALAQPNIQPGPNILDLAEPSHVVPAVLAAPVPQGQANIGNAADSLSHQVESSPVHRATSTPDLRRSAAPNALPASTPTRHSSGSHSPVVLNSAYRSQSRASTPLTSTRSAHHSNHPVTPRAFSPGPTSRPASAALFRPVGRPLLDTSSVLNSRASTPCPSAFQRSGIPQRVAHPPFAANASPAPAWQPSLPPSPLTVSSSAHATNRLRNDHGWDEPNDATTQAASPHTDERGQPALTHRVRTPPPLAQARAYASIATSNAETRPTEHGLGNEEYRLRPQPLPVNLAPRAANPAPTTAELAFNKNNEIRTFKKARKSTPKANAPALRSGKRVSDLKKEEQSLLSVMKACILWEFLVTAPWPEDEEALALKAKDFAIASTGLSVDEAGANTLCEAAIDGFSQLRGRCHPAVLDAVVKYYGVTAGDLPTMTHLTTNSRFLYPDDNMHPRDFCNVTVLGTVLQVILFPGYKNIGVIYMDKLLRRDDPVEMETLLDLVALPGPDGTPTRPTFADTSASASRGVPIAALAYGCVLASVVFVCRSPKLMQLNSQIHHALDRLKTSEKKREFHKNTYAGEWAFYVRELVQHRQLGTIRTAFTDMLKTAYCTKWVRKGRPIGEDHAW